MKPLTTITLVILSPLLVIALIVLTLWFWDYKEAEQE